MKPQEKSPSRRWRPAVLALLLPAAAQAQSEAVETVQITAERRVVTATRVAEDPLDLPFSTYAVGRDEMDAVGARTLEDALRAVPGLQHGTQGNYFTRFETRGLRDTQDVLVLIDGVPLRLLQGNADLTLVAPDLLERIEFIKGPASALYGRNAIGGVVQMFIEPEAEGGSARATLGSFGRRDLGLRQRWDGERGHLSVGAAYSRVDGFQDGTPRDQATASVGGELAMTRDWASGVQLFSSQVNAQRGSIVPLKNGHPMFGIDPEDNYGIPGAHVDGEYLSLAWRNRVRLTPAISFEHLSSGARYDRLFQGGITIVPPPAAVTKGWSETDTQDRGLFHEFTLNAKAEIGATQHALQLGLNLESGWQDQASPSFSGAPTYRGPDYDTPVSNVGNDPRGIRGPVTDSRFDQRVRSLYLQDRIDIGALSLSAGLRHDRFEQTLRRSGTTVQAHQEASRTSPRLGADWRYAASAASENALFANWAEGFRPQAVALNTRSGVVVPALLRPEVTRSVEIGAKGRALDDRWSYQVALFQADKTDGQRSFRTGPDSFIFTNASSRVRGLETLLRARLSAAWSGYAHYTWQDARLRDFPTYDSAGNPGPNYAGNRMRMSARHIAGAGLAWSQGAWQWTGSANHVGRRPLRDNIEDSQILPSYTLLATAVTWQATPRLSVQAGVDNLADVEYIADDFSSQEAGCFGTPRSLFLRLKAQW